MAGDCGSALDLSVVMGHGHLEMSLAEVVTRASIYEQTNRIAFTT
jgi:hypothetical protein